MSTLLLGEAFEPEQRFENPDGSDIEFEWDYFGEAVSGKFLAGPFAAKEEAVWDLLRNR